ncbi:MAG TPA: glycosyltransferase family 4 protein [Prolixibacteraceae bacterium]|nr:glycosyltransferase family 4 protein [Prolixibacteraceae bacterium]
MRVLMFGWEYPPNISGGLGTACYGLSRGLSSIGDIELAFVVPKVFGGEDKSGIELIGAGDVSVTNSRISFEQCSNTIEYLEVSSGLVPYVGPKEYLQQESYTVEGIKSLLDTDSEGKINFSGRYGPDLFREIAKYAYVGGIIARDRDFDVIHAHDWLTYPAGIAAKARSGKPLVVHVHATDFDRSGGNVNPEVYKIEKMGMMAADKVITVSNLTRMTVIDKYGIRPDKVVTVYNAVEPWSPKIQSKVNRGYNDKIVTFLGRVTMQKGPGYFISAANKILQKFENVRFVMAGSGDLLNTMIRSVARLRISDKFHFAGFLKGDAVFRMFGMSDVFVMPSVSEPFGISPLEAMQAGVPVVISRQSGVSEILTNAVKVDFWDIDAMADAICGILQYPAVSKMLSEKGKEESNAFRWTDSARHVRDVYCSLV